ncbi:MAG: VOC family protein [Verrucomicrobiota bacterium]
MEHIGLAAGDPERLKNWCVQALDAIVVLADGKTPPAFFVQLAGGALIEIYASEKRLDETSNNRLAGWRHMALRVQSIEAARDTLSQRGVEFEPTIKPAGGGGRVLFFRDPENNLWHLVERPADAALTLAAPKPGARP